MEDSMGYLDNIFTIDDSNNPSTPISIL